MHQRFYATDLPRSSLLATENDRLIDGEQTSSSSSSTSFSASQASLLSFFSSSSSSSSLIAIKYINRGDYPQKFDSAVWKLNMFICSDIKLPSTGKYHVKCIECNCTNDLGGTNPLANHAESKHRDLPRVAEWLAAKKALAAAKRDQKEYSDTKLIQVCFSCLSLSFML